MSQEIEIEYKQLLTKEEYERIHERFSFTTVPSQLQTNYYFETRDFQLKRVGAALRIREKNSTWKLTLKEQHHKGLLETHDTLTEKEAMSWISGKILPKQNVTKQLKKLEVSNDQLVYWGSLVTKRKELAVGQVLLVLDVSKYNGRKDFELEIEAKTKAAGETFFNELIAMEHISPTPTMNKIQRFFNTLPNK
ncbi:CYTH domain-containing protein [Aquibacillus sp. 3ASR75-11]|uniref:CYTH domain-containing protein n=1 Tax=Terrihalobacillus insolitus TaxID=2950438 RepID=A0A9X4AN35_9BACI|nr:CYTH domain-containing protein [Terrihalobacillus insolitus]MDC3413670.1 CYTH domain-containing protein [Terrihalobacillus insolitus]MDC3425439.1 CYTH domain-containing protein [Terrihalobacillus insolitus]